MNACEEYEYLSCEEETIFCRNDEVIEDCKPCQVIQKDVLDLRYRFINNICSILGYMKVTNILFFVSILLCYIGMTTESLNIMSASVVCCAICALTCVSFSHFLLIIIVVLWGSVYVKK